MAGSVASLADKALATFLDAHILAGYTFLMNNYRNGDKIFLFGFSRGAYVARCLAGMLHKVGLLNKANHEQVGFAYKAYIDTGTGGQSRGERFKKTFSRAVGIEFVGCWDTVASVGLVHQTNLPFSSSNYMVKVFRHALALDERRAKFLPTLWRRKAPKDALVSTVKDPNSPIRKAGRAYAVKSLPFYHLGRLTRGLIGLFWRGLQEDEKLAKKASELKKISTKDDKKNYGDAKTDVVEVWFAGGHADVGGGNIAINSVEPSLSGASFRWMLFEAVSKGLLLHLEETDLIELGLPQNRNANPPAENGEYTSPTGSGEHVPRAGPGELDPPPNNGAPTGPIKVDEQAQQSGRSSNVIPPHNQQSSYSLAISESTSTNALIPQTPPDESVSIAVDGTEPGHLKAEIHDNLKRLWWKWAPLELVPFRRSFQDGEGRYHQETKWNLGRAREIYVRKDVKGRYIGPKFHCTVSQRKARVGGYDPRAKFVYIKGEERSTVLAKDVIIEYVEDGVVDLSSHMDMRPEGEPL